MKQIERYVEFVRPYYSEKDPAHNFQHIERILARLEAFSVGMSPEPRADWLCFHACFHGLWTKCRDSEEFRNKASEFLRSLGWAQGDIEQAIQGLSRQGTDPQTVEEQIVCDANAIERVGAFSIAKAFMTGGARGQSLEETADIFEYRNLDKVEFRTPVGKRLAEERQAYAKAFLARLREEW